MSISAFGVEHVSKKDQEKVKHYDRMGNLMGGIAAGSGGIGAVSGAIGAAERRGKDPMGFTQRISTSPKKQLSPAAKARKLGKVAAAHTSQAKAMGALAVGTAALAGGYKHAKRKELAKAFTSKQKEKARDVGLGAGATGVGAGAAYQGGLHTKFLGEAAVSQGNAARNANQAIRVDRKNRAAGIRTRGYVLPKKEIQLMRELRRTGAKVAGVKGVGTLAAAGVGAAGVAGAGEVARHAHASRKKREVGKGMSQSAFGIEHWEMD